MLIAKEKEKENIVEYILYMWQMEDLIRGLGLDLKAILTQIFPDDAPSEVKLEYKKWFAELIEEMKLNQLEKKGHLKSVQDYMNSLEYLHKSLLTSFLDQDYIKLYDACKSDITALRLKSNTSKNHDTEVCLIGLYGILVLRIGKKTISEDTEKAMKVIGKMMVYLSESYHRLKNGSLVLPSQLNN